jgi:hypothetical protein
VSVASIEPLFVALIEDDDELRERAEGLAESVAGDLDTAFEMLPKDLRAAAAALDSATERVRLFHR